MKRALACLAAGALVAGCGVTRDGALSPSVNDCVAALPVAQTLLGGAAHLRKLRRYSLDRTQGILAKLAAPKLTPRDATPAERASLAPFLPAGASPSPRPRPTDSAGRPLSGPRPCVLEYSGNFTAATVAGAKDLGAESNLAGASSGRWALVVTTTRHPRLLRVVITTTEPLAGQN